ncbi:glycosyltransferase family 4 protein [Marinobacter hydrocarbonoclasticus]|uniref:glycosyltransferase family 4 protein n=1 Tax=Marinobacter nauticus TaxID=2743 RepID=UPI001C97EE48|nr:glycosyltransferase family 4 protein [Marinobacter nauticus]MBY6192898.1 glycosyltransferase family 4 protein [Marinobacter nauticus]MBY6214046.1 glycosyltransferase family 4 protein [Marinobacter nauticus]
MKTFLLIASFPDSLIKFRGPLLRALVAKGLDVHVAAPDLADVPDIRTELEALGITLHEIGLKRTGTNPVADLATVAELWRLMRRIRADYVLGYTIKPVIYGSLAAWLAGLPNRFALVTGLGYAFTGEASGKRGLLRKLIQRLYRFGLSKSRKVFFQNPDDEALFRQLKLLPADIPSCVVNGSGVDVADYALAPLLEKPSFLLIARLLGDKGVREYAQAARKVKTQYPDAVFRLVGWIDDNPDAISQQELDEWVNTGIVEFLGKLADVRPAIADCNVYVLPSYREGTPRTVLEAMAMGRPVITTDAPGCRETVTDGDNGFLVPLKAVDELAAAMIRFIENPKLVGKMGQRSRQVAEQKYDVHRVNEFMLAEMGIK